MSAAEKWDLLQRDPSALDPPQLRRELARLFMCLNFDLFHDPGLAEGAVEFNAYLDLGEALEAVSDDTAEGLKEQALAGFRGLDPRDTAMVEAVLGGLREAIGRSVGLVPPFDYLFRNQMEPWPRTPPPELPGVVNPGVRDAAEGMSLQQLQTSLRVLLELMPLDEQRRELEAIRSRYRSLGDLPADVLKDLLPRLSMGLGDKTICDFALRYRSGRLWAMEPINPRVWQLLSFSDRFMLLEADNQAMDVLQAARHLSRLLLTERYECLFDPAYQVWLTHEPIYRRVLDHCMGRLSGADALQSLSRQVTRMMLEIETVVPDGERPGRFLAIREVLGTGLELGSGAEKG